MGDKLNRFKDLVIQDSTIIRLHESLAKIWPAARSKKVSAGVKVSCVVSAIANSPKSVRIYPERTAEAKILRLGPWLKGCILLLELGYFKYLFFDRIVRYGGYFVSRLKVNANRYMPLRWAKVFTEQADRLLTEVLECVRLKLEPICSLNTTFTSAMDAIQMSSERG